MEFQYFLEGSYTNGKNIYKDQSYKKDYYPKTYQQRIKDARDVIMMKSMQMEKLVNLLENKQIAEQAGIEESIKRAYSWMYFEKEGKEDRMGKIRLWEEWRQIEGKRLGRMNLAWFRYNYFAKDKTLLRRNRYDQSIFGMFLNIRQQKQKIFYLFHYQYHQINKQSLRHIHISHPLTLTPQNPNKQQFHPSSILSQMSPPPSPPVPNSSQSFPHLQIDLLVFLRMFSIYKQLIQLPTQIFFIKLIIIDMFKRFLPILTIVAVAFAACPLNNNIDNLIASSTTFNVDSNLNANTQNYVYNFGNSFQNTPVIALAVQDFSFKEFGANTWAVYPSSLSNSQLCLAFDYSAPALYKIRVNFWVSTHSQIQLGYFKVDNIQTLTSCNCALAYANINNPFASTDNPVVRVFINGFGVSSNVAQISVSPINLQGTKLSIRVTIGATTTLNKIWLSWLAFSPSTASFGSYGGQVSQSKYTGSISSDISNSLYQNSYALYGLNLISIASQTPLEFTSEIDNSFVLTISSSAQIDNFALIYVAFGVLPGKLCTSCGNGLVANAGECVSACPAGTYSFTYKDGGVGCRTCSRKLGLILASGKCAAATTTTYTVTTTTTVSAKLPTDGVQTIAAQTNNSSQTVQAVQTNQATQTTQTTQATQTTQGSTVSQGAKTVNPAPAPTVFKPTCPPNAYFVENGACACNVGFTYTNGQCKAITSSPIPTPIQIIKPKPDQIKTDPIKLQPIKTEPKKTCSPNSYDNGLGICICENGYYFSSGVCATGAPCGANSQRNATGVCVCSSGFTSYNGVCSRCPPGALWSSKTNKCIYVCGQNSAYSQAASACVCNPGYGLFGGFCQTCPADYFISNGYCVTCPVNSNYNTAKKSCECLTGFFTNQWGVCARKCGTNEVYNPQTQSCGCLSGLAKVNGICQICPAGSTPSDDGSFCSICQQNQVLISGECVCKQGFAYNSANVCTECSALPGGFVTAEGYCAVCPGNMVRVGDTCTCTQGKVAQGSLCVSQCQNDELLDKDGNCYTCGLNQVISADGQCVCSAGYTLNDCGVCVLSCQSGQFTFQGACATCPLNTVFNSAINGCSCPNGFYMNTYGVCQKLTIQPITCPSGQYFDNNSGCQACSSSCATCKSANQCVTCANDGFSANAQGICTPVCGDGKIVGGETCDTGKAASTGCVSCQIQIGFTCTGQPSVCRSNQVTQPTQTTNQTIGQKNITKTSTALSQLGKTNINSNNVYITLKIGYVFTFNNPTEMQGFLQATFPSGTKPTVYCAQRNSPNLDLFDCLLIYPSGVPNRQFAVNFAYNYQGKSGSLSVTVNPLAIKTNSRK